MSEHYLSVREFAGLLSLARITVIKWIKSGKIVAYSGRWRIPYSEVERTLKGIQRIKKVAIHARINNNTQRDDLEKQIETLKLWTSKNLPQAKYIVVTDIASSLKEDRRGLRKLIELKW